MFVKMAEVTVVETTRSLREIYQKVVGNVVMYAASVGQEKKSCDAKLG
jgi:hypothetical protein